MPRLESLHLLPIWVAPSHLVRTARQIAEGEQTPIVTVLDRGQVAGYVRSSELASAGLNSSINDHVQPFSMVLDAGHTIREAAREMVKHGADFAPVTREDQFLGLVTIHSILDALLEDGDSLTGLRWSDHLRDWGSEQLQAGREICVIVFDIPEFGHFNRRFGYQVGDQLLLAVKSALEAHIDPKLDILVRHSGDELLVGTSRTRSEAMELAKNMKAAAIAAIAEDGLGTIPLSFGMSGGYRTLHREMAHTSAMIDDLIRLAKIDQSNRKDLLHSPIEDSHQTSLAVASISQGPYVASVEVENGADSAVSVVVQLPEGAFTGRVSLPDGLYQNSHQSLSKAVSNATVQAILSGHPELRVAIEDVSAFDQPDGSRLVSVFGNLVTPVDTFSITGSSRVTGSFAEAVAEATLLAFLNLNLPAIAS